LYHIRGKFIAVNGYIKKSERSQINNPILQLQRLRKTRVSQPNSADGKKDGAGISEIQTKRTAQRIDETKKRYTRLTTSPKPTT
jgi:hypothetical protein